MTRDAIHPGRHLADLMAEENLSANHLARQLQIPTNRVTGILHGTRNVTPDTALRLAHWFGDAPETWLDLQQAYDIEVTRERIKHELRKMPPRRKKARP